MTLGLDRLEFVGSHTVMNSNERLIVNSITGADLDLPIAGPGGRSYAFIIDWHIRFFIALLWLVVAIGLISQTTESGNFTDNPLAGLWLLAVLPAAIIYFLYHPILEVLMKGSTPGKRVADIRIVTQQGNIPSSGALIIRNVFRILDSLPGFYVIGLVTTIFTKQSVRVGDLAAGTLLVYQSRAKSVSIDEITRLGRGDNNPEMVELIQDVLDRWNQLDSPTRRKFAARLLAHAGINSMPNEDDDLRDQMKKLLN